MLIAISRGRRRELYSLLAKAKEAEAEAKAKATLMV